MVRVAFLSIFWLGISLFGMVLASILRLSTFISYWCLEIVYFLQAFGINFYNVSACIVVLQLFVFVLFLVTIGYIFVSILIWVWG